MRHKDALTTGFTHCEYEFSSALFWTDGPSCEYMLRFEEFETSYETTIYRWDGENEELSAIQHQEVDGMSQLSALAHVLEFGARATHGELDNLPTLWTT